MTSLDPGDGQPSSDVDRHWRDHGPYVLRPLLEDAPLSADGSQSNIKINCIEYLDRNLYVGTSASELLHFVQIPPDPNERNGKPAYILASRLSPNYVDVSGTSSASLPGVQQIVLLPRAGKACVQCNWTVTFYSLPEMSPAFPSRQIKGCNFIGGIDLNELSADNDADYVPGDVSVLASTSKRIQAIRIGDELRPTQKIELPGVTLAIRRDSIACVADSKSYSLLDVERQLRIPLMSISSLDESPSPDEIGHAQNLPTDTGAGIQRSSSSALSRPTSSVLSHSRSKSETMEQMLGLSPAPSPSPRPPGDAVATSSADKPLPDAPSGAEVSSRPSAERSPERPVFLRPHIASPTPDEFLVFRGTSPVEPCIGMFVNLDGDPTRAPVIFDRYPKAVVLDGSPVDLSSSRSGPQDDDEGFVLASLSKEVEDGLRNGIEVLSLNASNNPNAERHWLEAEGVPRSVVYGLRSLTGKEEVEFEEIVDRLCQRRFLPFSGGVEASTTASLKSVDSRTALSMERLSNEKELFERDFDSQEEEPLPAGWEETRNSEAEEFARRLAKAESGLTVWAGSRVWWAIRNPLIVRLDSFLEAACPKGYAEPQLIDRRSFVAVLGSIRNRDARTELEFLSLGYLKQKAGILLLMSMLRATGDTQFSNSEVGALQELLVESNLDPRVVLSLIPGVRNEIVEGRTGIWIYGGVKKAVDAYIRSLAFEKIARNTVGTVDNKTLDFLRVYLTAWRGMKGMPSVPDETEVFKTVDAALLLVLLELDKNSPTGLGRPGSIRTELYDIVDKGTDCFERAVDLLESHHRLFVLSRLYQSRRLAGDVLATWRRIAEGERDDGQELRDGEQQVRDYLTKIRSQPLVQEYGVWLANRNPKLGVQVFTEDKGRAGKFDPIQVVELLKEEAPDAVKYYLEHLVFGKGNSTYVNDLIAYYVDVVVTELESSKASRETVMATYDAYRALQAPKPTYQQFLTDNAPADDEVWHSRLRLLQLLGGAHDYDALVIQDRISALPNDLLVPETIVLAGQERNHEVALRLLVHKLGDYDTAVSYCLRGGTSLDSSPSSQGLRRADSLPTAEQQRRLFRAVLHEFLAIADASERIEQTGALLERFGGWYEVDEVLGLIPDSWSVDIVAGFLVGALRRLVREKHEAKVTRALRGAENLRVSYDVVVTMDEKGPIIEAPT